MATVRRIEKPPMKKYMERTRPRRVAIRTPAWHRIRKTTSGAPMRCLPGTRMWKRRWPPPRGASIRRKRRWSRLRASSPRLNPCQTASPNSAQTTGGTWSKVSRCIGRASWSSPFPAEWRLEFECAEALLEHNSWQGFFSCLHIFS